MGDGVRFGTQAREAPIPQNQMAPMQATRRSTAENGEMSIPFPQSVPSATPSAPGEDIRTCGKRIARTVAQGSYCAAYMEQRVAQPEQDHRG